MSISVLAPRPACLRNVSQCAWTPVCVCVCACACSCVCVRVCVYARLKRLSEKEEEPEEQVSVENGWCKRKQISREGYQKTYPVWDACSQGTQSHRGHPSGKMKAVLQG